MNGFPAQQPLPPGDDFLFLGATFRWTVKQGFCWILCRRLFFLKAKRNANRCVGQ